MSETGIPQGRVRRVAPVAALTARTAGEAVVVALRKRATGREDPEFALRSAERYAQLLGSSKGALMKAGQMISFWSMGEIVPPEFQATYQAALGRLRSDVPPMPEALVRPVLEAELGRGADEAFVAFDWTPLAAASIGQVHRAQLHDGREVAVKIQYPGVAAAIRDDLRNGELLGTFFRLVGGIAPGGASFDVKAAAAEVSERITEELDYRIEAAYQTEFHGYFDGHPFIHVPEVIADCSGERVLTQELATGLPWAEALEADQALRDRWGEVLCRFTWGAQARHCVVHADPHPGNYLFGEDGSMTFLDFGCVKRLTRTALDAVYAIIRAELAGDVEGTWRAALAAGFYAEDGPVTRQDAYEYWHDGDEMYWGEQPFTVTPEYAAATIERRYTPVGPSRNAFMNNTAHGGMTTLARVDTGFLSILGALNATNDYASLIAETVDGAPPQTELGRLEAEYLAARDWLPG